MEALKEYIDPCRRLTNLGMQAAKLKKGVVSLQLASLYMYGVDVFLNQHFNFEFSIDILEAILLIGSF